MTLSPAQREHLQQITEDIADAQRPVRILRALAWPESVRQAFFAAGARELPRVSYPQRFDWRATVERFDAIKKRVVGEGELERLLRETCESFATAARMLGAVGTRAFYWHSIELYGRPASVSSDGKTTNIALATHFDEIMNRYADVDFGAGDEDDLTAEDVAVELERRFAHFFEGHRIRVEVVAELSANAVAGADVVKLRRGVRFSRRDIDQLEHHEGYVHVATTLNGRSQPVLPFLGSSAPRTTRTQEGLAIFTEFMSQTMDIERLRRLADRVVAIKMAEDGADFLDLYRYFVGHGHAEAAAFECARRVVRGGLCEGGAPFTKDVVYLDGLVRVKNFLRAAITRRHPEFVATLFVGKVDVEDVPLMHHLLGGGLLTAPRYLPPWARDMRYLTAFMSWSAFLDKIDVDAAEAHFDELVLRAAAPLPARS